MKEDLEERLVSQVMGWDAKESKMEHRNLRALAMYGYDEYMQFGPGMRFVEKMALWLSQFKQEERQAAYDFAIKRVLFITRAQMEQAVSITYPDVVVPMLMRQVADESRGRFTMWDACNIFNSMEFRILHAQSLFAGMSDGSHMDLFRRGSPEVSHEQVVRTHEMNESRAKELGKDLRKRVSRFGGQNDSTVQPLFRNVFLIDDFSASGKSYIRPSDDPSKKAGGKIARFCDSITAEMEKLINPDDLRIHVVLYVATDRAVDAIKTAARNLLPSMSITVRAVCRIPSAIRLDESADVDFYKLVSQKKYGWANPPDQHIKKGQSKKPYLGFDHCALPLILHHNTPNNSLPILYAMDNNFGGLFPRIARHRQ